MTEPWMEAAAREWFASIASKWFDGDEPIQRKAETKRLVEILARHAAARQEWVSVETELPSEKELVEVCGSKRLPRAMAYRRGDEWLVETSSDTVNIYPPKYWRKLGPLPAAPQPELATYGCPKCGLNLAEPCEHMPKSWRPAPAAAESMEEIKQRQIALEREHPEMRVTGEVFDGGDGTTRAAAEKE